MAKYNIFLKEDQTEIEWTHSQFFLILNLNSTIRLKSTFFVKKFQNLSCIIMFYNIQH